MNKIEENIWQWIIEYIEVENEFYNYKFPPCPFAKSARIKGMVDVIAYSTGSPYKFIKHQIEDLNKDNKFNVRVMAFPMRMRWYLHLHFMLNCLNKKLISKDLYVQYGKTDNYFIVIANKLSDVLEGHKALLKTDYYKNWSKKHYSAVVIRRQQVLQDKKI